MWLLLIRTGTCEHLYLTRDELSVPLPHYPVTVSMVNSYWLHWSVNVHSRSELEQRMNWLVMGMNHFLIVAVLVLSNLALSYCAFLYTSFHSHTPHGHNGYDPPLGLDSGQCNELSRSALLDQNWCKLVWCQRSNCYPRHDPKQGDSSSHEQSPQVFDHPNALAVDHGYELPYYGSCDTVPSSMMEEPKERHWKEWIIESSESSISDTEWMRSMIGHATEYNDRMIFWHILHTHILHTHILTNLIL